MESQIAEKKKKEKKKKKQKKDSIVTSCRWRKEIYGNEEWKALIKGDMKKLKKRYYMLFDREVKPNEFQSGVLYDGLAEKLVLLMIKARINSDEYGIEIKKTEVEPIIDKLKEGGLL